MTETSTSTSDPLSNAQIVHETFDELKKEKKNRLINLFCFYMLFAFIVGGGLEISQTYKLLVLAMFGIVLLADHFGDLKTFTKLVKANERIEDMVQDQMEFSNVLKTLVSEAEPRVNDSIAAANLQLKMIAKDTGSDGASREIDVDREFDAVLLLKRKSLPVDEIIKILHKGKVL